MQGPPGIVRIAQSTLRGLIVAAIALTVLPAAAQANPPPRLVLIDLIVAPLWPLEQARQHERGKLRKDTDGDGLSNWTEVKHTRTNPHRRDTDRDRLSDWVEVKRTKTNPRHRDTDRDGLSDWVELRKTGTDPRKADSDEDSPPEDSPAPSPEPDPGPPPDTTPPQTTIDTIPPAVQVDSGPSGLTNNPSPTFGFSSETGATFQCSIDSGTPSFGPCSGAATHTPASPLSEGLHTFRVRATDSAANQATATRAFTIDSKAPNTQIDSKPPAAANSSNAQFAFSGSDGVGSGIASFECRRDGGAWASCSSPREYTGLAEDAHSFEVRAIDQAGNVDATPASVSWTIDTAPPAVQVNSGPNGLTNDSTPTFSFSSEPGATFQCSIDSGTPSFGPCSGANTHTPASPLSEGPHTFRVRATDAATNQATATRSFTVDTTAPPAPELTGTSPASPANDNTPQIIGTAPAGTTIRLYANPSCTGSPVATVGVAVLEAGIEASVADDSTTNFGATATTAAANTSGCSEPIAYVEDSSAPETQIDTKPASLVEVTTANFTFSGNDGTGSGVASFECRRDGGTWAACTSPKEYTGLADGAHSFEVKALDQAGNVDATPASFSWTVDTTPPAVQVNSGPSGLTNDSTPTFSFSSEPGATFQCSIDSGTPSFGPCSGANTHTPASPLSEGPHTFRVRATDAATNQATATRSFTVDTAAPPAPELSSTVPASPANDNTPQIAGSAPAGTTIRLYANASCTGSPVATVGVAVLEAGIEVSVADDSTTSFGATATTAAANTSGCSEPLAYAEDSTPPETTIGSKPAALVNSTSASFGFSGSDGAGSGVASFECRRDGGAWAVCTPPREYTGLAEGSHSFEVITIDQAGNVDASPASFSWTIDLTAPQVTVDSLSKALLKAGQTSEVTWHANENGAFEMRVGGADCNAGTVVDSGAYSNQPATRISNVTAAQLAEGANTLRLCLTDAAGNRGSATTTVSKDTGAPDTTIGTKPATLANSTTASFGFSGSDGAGSGVVSFECRRDGGAWAACTSPREYTGLAEGSHSFEVITIDQAGNVDASPASFSWTIDSQAPETQINSKPAALISSTAANFTFAGSDPAGSGVASFECRRDGGTWAACTSPKEYTGLADGAHSFEVRAIDQAGNVDATPASFSWTVDTTPPAVQVNSGPSGLTNNPSPAFSFSSEPGATFQCSIDNGTPSFGPCSGATTHTPPSPLSEGPHTFRVRATDAATNQATATRSFTVDTTAPPAPELSSTIPASPANDNTPQIAGSAPVGTTIRLYANATCTGSPVATVGVAVLEAGIEASVADDSTTNFGATATTAAENTSGCSEPLAYVEDSTPPETTIGAKPAALVNSTTADFTFSGNDGSSIASFECRRDGGAWAACTSPREYTALAEGAHSFEVKAIDAAGNVDASPASFNWTVDLTAPQVTVDSLSKALLKAGQTSEVAWHANENGGFELRVGGADCNAGTVVDSGTYSNQPATRVSSVTAAQLAEGANTLRLCLTDAAGNRGSATTTVSKDTTAPNTVIDSKPAALVNSASASFSFSGSDIAGSGVASFECRIDSGAWAACTSPREYAGLSDGSHNVEVKAIDAAGNVDGSPASFSWTIDTTAPNTQIDAKPAALVNSTSASFGFPGSDGAGSGVASFECRRDGGAWASCTSPREYTGLAEGAHSFEVKAIDAAGNVDASPASFNWTIDLTAPQVTVDSLSKALLKAGQTSEVTWHANENGGFELRVGGADCNAGTVVDSGTYSNQPATRISNVTAAQLAEGANTLRLCLTDAAGNRGSATTTVSKDTGAPDTTIGTKPATLANSTTASFGFSGSDGAGSGVVSFECRRDGGTWAACTSPKEYTGLADGAHSFEVRAIDQAGNVDATPASFSWTVDTTPPAVQVNSGPSGLTNNPSPAFSFSSEPGATFQCSIDNGTPSFGPCSGANTHTPPSPLSEGPHTFRVRATDAATNQATATRSFTVDTTAPPAPELSSTIPASPANDNTPQIAGSAPVGTTIRLYANATCTGSPVATVGVAVLEAGIEASVADDSTTNFGATATTAAENTSGCSEPLAYVEDSTPPETTIGAKPAALVNSTTADFTFSGNDGSSIASFECRRDGGAWAACTSPREYTALAEGAHSFEVKAIDAAGNVDASPASFNWTVDLTAPQVTVDSLSKALLKAGQTSEVAWHANENGGFELRVGGADCNAGTVVDSGTYSNQPATRVSSVTAAQLAEGANTLRLCLTDAAGNRGSATTTVSKDTTAPNTVIDSKPAALVNSASASFSFSGSDIAGSGVASFECRIDSGAWAACTSPREYAGLSDGSHNVEVKAIDAAGNVDGSPASFSWTIDTTAPNTQIDAKPAALVNSTSASFGFSGSDGAGSGVASFECRRDGGAWAACTSPREYTALAEGAHSFEVKAIDAAGNVDASPASFNWTIDLTAPQVTVDSLSKALLKAGQTSEVTWHANENGGFELRVGGADCNAGTVVDSGTYSNQPATRISNVTAAQLAEGANTLRLCLTDAAGNRGFATTTLNKDTGAPDTQITVKPAALVNSTSASFSFSGSDGTGSGVASFECRRNGGAWADCSSPREYTGLADGAHSFEVKAVDQAGNVDATPASFSWTVDSTAPNTQIDTKPAALVNSANASFNFSGSDVAGSGVASFECRIDSGAWAACTSPREYTGLAEGAHSFEVKALDQAGNVDPTPATYSWTVDTMAPNTQIDAKPDALVNSTSASFGFSGSDPSGSGVVSFECRRDGGAWAACTSPREYTGLAEGAHSFEVKALDAAGNVDATPASFSWTIDSKAPETQIGSKPAALTNSTAASFAFSGSDPSGSGVDSFECRRDGGAWAACTSPKEYTGLADGAHSFEVKAIDAAGNVDVTPASASWTIDTTPPAVQVESGPSGLTNNPSPTFGFNSEPGATFQCSIDSGTPAFGPCSGATTHTPASPLAEGSHTFRVQATDAAANQATATRGFTVDTTAPPAPELTGTSPASPANDNTPQIVGSAAAGTTIRLYASASCTGSPVATVGVAALETGIEVSVDDDSTTSFGATATTPAENTSGCSEPLVYVEDSAAPETMIDAKPAAVIASDTASFIFSGSDPSGSGIASFECRRDGGTWAACISPREYTGLAEGSHSFEVKTIDQAGNVDPTPANFSWTIDLTAPQVTVDSLSEALLKAGQTSEVTWHANENGAFELRVGGGDCNAGTVVDSGTYSNQPATRVSSVTAAQLAEGANTLRLCLTDPAGNRGSATTTVSKDTDVPNTTIGTKPAASTSSTSASFTFSGSDPGGSGVASFECRRDGAAWAACVSPRESTGLAEGPHTFEVKAVDQAGNVDTTPASFDWTIDMTPPTVQVKSGPSGLTHNPSPTFGFNSEPGATFQCSIDNGTPAFGPCSGATTHTPASPLAEGSHTFRVQATDAAANQATATRSFTVDTTAPPAPELTAISPPSPANDNNPQVTGTALTGATVTLYPSAECLGSPVATGTAAELEAGIVIPVADDSTTVFGATVTGAERTSGCSEPLTYVEDSSAPETTISSSPPATTLSTSASFFFTASEPGSSFECKLDGAAFASCQSPRSFANLPLGSHSLSVRATDTAGNLDPTPAVWSWTIDAPPSVTPSACTEGGTKAITAAEVRSAVQKNQDVCVTADVGNVNLSSLGARPVVVSTEGGSMGDVDLASTTGLTISLARFRSIEMRGSHRTLLLDNTIGGTQASRVLDQLIFMPDTNNDVTIEGNDIGWTIADLSGNTGYGCRCYGTLNRLRFVGNRLHDLAADGFQGVDGVDVVIDRNEIGPIGRNPESNEHTDNIQITGNDANLRITNNWIHHQGYFEGNITANAGSTYIHGGSASSLVYENNLIETAQGRSEICGLGTGGEERSNLTIRRNTWVEGGLAFNGFPSFEWDCDSGTGNMVERNIAVDPDGGLKMSSFASAAIFSANLWGQPSLVTLDAAGNCTSANCNPAEEEPIGYRKPSGVSW